MATFRNRRGKWQASVQRKGQQPISKSFQSKEDAKHIRAAYWKHGEEAIETKAERSAKSLIIPIPDRLRQPCRAVL